MTQNRIRSRTFIIDEIKQAITESKFNKYGQNDGYLNRAEPSYVHEFKQYDRIKKELLKEHKGTPMYPSSLSDEQKEVIANAFYQRGYRKIHDVKDLLIQRLKSLLNTLREEDMDLFYKEVKEQFNEIREAVKNDFEAALIFAPSKDYDENYEPQMREILIGDRFISNEINTLTEITIFQEMLKMNIVNEVLFNKFASHNALLNIGIYKNTSYLSLATEIHTPASIEFIIRVLQELQKSIAEESSESKESKTHSQRREFIFEADGSGFNIATTASFHTNFQAFRLICESLPTKGDRSRQVFCSLANENGESDGATPLMYLASKPESPLNDIFLKFILKHLSYKDFFDETEQKNENYNHWTAFHFALEFNNASAFEQMATCLPGLEVSPKVSAEIRERSKNLVDSLIKYLHEKTTEASSKEEFDIINEQLDLLVNNFNDYTHDNSSYKKLTEFLASKQKELNQPKKKTQSAAVALSDSEDDKDFTPTRRSKRKQPVSTQASEESKEPSSKRAKTDTPKPSPMDTTVDNATVAEELAAKKQASIPTASAGAGSGSGSGFNGSAGAAGSGSGSGFNGSAGAAGAGAGAASLLPTFFSQGPTIVSTNLNEIARLQREKRKLEAKLQQLLKEFRQKKIEQLTGCQQFINHSIQKEMQETAIVSETSHETGVLFQYTALFDNMHKEYIKNKTSIEKELQDIHQKLVEQEKIHREQWDKYERELKQEQLAAQQQLIASQQRLQAAYSQPSIVFPGLERFGQFSQKEVVSYLQERNDYTRAHGIPIEPAAEGTIREVDLIYLTRNRIRYS